MTAAKSWRRGKMFNKYDEPASKALGIGLGQAAWYNRSHLSAAARCHHLAAVPKPRECGHASQPDSLKVFHCRGGRRGLGGGVAYWGGLKRLYRCQDATSVVHLECCCLVSVQAMVLCRSDCGTVSVCVCLCMFLRARSKS